MSGYVSRHDGAVCAKPACNEPRLTPTPHRRSRYCLKHDAEQQERRRLLDMERALEDCTLATLYERWTTHPFGADGYVGGRQVLGMTPVGDAPAFRVVLAGANESVVLPADTVVTLRKSRTRAGEAQDELAPPHRRTWALACKVCGAPRDDAIDRALCHEHYNAHRREQRKRQTARQQAARAQS